MTVKALALAIQHIEHMAAWIAKQNAGYSFESLGEDMPGMKAALTAPQQPKRGEREYDPQMNPADDAEFGMKP